MGVGTTCHGHPLTGRTGMTGTAGERPESHRVIDEQSQNGPPFGAQTLPQSLPPSRALGAGIGALGPLPGRLPCGLRIASRHIWPLPSANCYTTVRFWVAQAPSRAPLLRPTDSESAHMAPPKCQLLHYGEILGGPGPSRTPSMRPTDSESAHMAPHGRLPCGLRIASRHI